MGSVRGRRAPSPAGVDRKTNTNEYYSIFDRDGVIREHAFKTAPCVGLIAQVMPRDADYALAECHTQKCELRLQAPLLIRTSASPFELPGLDRVLEWTAFGAGSEVFAL